MESINWTELNWTENNQEVKLSSKVTNSNIFLDLSVIFWSLLLSLTRSIRQPTSDRGKFVIFLSGASAPVGVSLTHRNSYIFLLSMHNDDDDDYKTNEQDNSDNNREQLPQRRHCDNDETATTTTTTTKTTTTTERGMFMREKEMFLCILTNRILLPLLFRHNNEQHFSVWMNSSSV